MVRATALLFYAALFDAAPVGAILSTRAVSSQLAASIMLSDSDNAILGLDPLQSAELQERRRWCADLRDCASAEHFKGTGEAVLIIAAQRRSPIEELEAELERGLARRDREDIYIIATECEG